MLLADEEQPEHAYGDADDLLKGEGFLIEQESHYDKDAGKGNVGGERGSIDLSPGAVDIDIAKFQRNNACAEQRGSPVDPRDLLGQFQMPSLEAV